MDESQKHLSEQKKTDKSTHWARFFPHLYEAIE